jgi:hypoxanthine phosphoribosyltransferase
VTDIDLDIKDRDVLIVDDVFDTGKSFRFVDKHLKDKGAKSVTGFALLAKPDRQEVVYRPKYIGFNVADMWVEGYGMDSAEKGRSNPDVIGKTND